MNSPLPDLGSTVLAPVPLRLDGLYRKSRTTFSSVKGFVMALDITSLIVHTVSVEMLPLCPVLEPYVCR